MLGGFLLIGLSFSILSRLVPDSTRANHHHDHGGDHGHSHDHPHGHEHKLAHKSLGAFADEDAHAAHHATEIKSQFTGRAGTVTNREIAWFGFTGGLLPCPAAFAVLLACLHQKAYGLGIVMVAAFSIGLAAMMVAVGVAAAWGLTAIKSKTGAFDRFARAAPYVSAAVVFIIGVYAVAQGLRAFGLM